MTSITEIISINDKYLSIEEIIQRAFPKIVAQNEITDSYIITNYNLMELEDGIDLLLYVPTYMLWCVRNKDNYDQLVTDYTINSIAEFGRCKVPNSFKYCCNIEQKVAIVAFLQWCQKNILIGDEAQIERTLRRWKSAIKM